MLAKGDKHKQGIFWLRDESIEDSANLPDTDILAEEIIEDLRSAFEEIYQDASEPISTSDQNGLGQSIRERRLVEGFSNPMVKVLQSDVTVDLDCLDILISFAVELYRSG